jgi:hypothetical protein
MPRYCPRPACPPAEADPDGRTAAAALTAMAAMLIIDYSPQVGLPPQ